MTTKGNNRLPVLAGEIRKELAAVRHHHGEVVRHALAAGERLIEARDAVPHGQWLPWLREHCQMSDRTARVYMQLARGRAVVEAKLAGAADLTIEAALAAIEEAARPPETMAKVGALATDAGTYFFGLIEKADAPGRFNVKYVLRPRADTEQVRNTPTPDFFRDASPAVMEQVRQIASNAAKTRGMAIDAIVQHLATGDFLGIDFRDETRSDMEAVLHAASLKRDSN